MNITDIIDRHAAMIIKDPGPARAEHVSARYVGALAPELQLQILDEIGDRDYSRALTSDAFARRMREGFAEVREFLAAFALAECVRAAAVELLHEQLCDAGDEQEIGRVDWCVDCAGQGHIHCTACGGSGVTRG